MNSYDPHRWTSHLFDIEGSMVREILVRVSVSVIWAAVVVALVLYEPEYFRSFAIPSTAHALVGTALGLLLVFRTNSSYDRFWEGRKQWGGIVNECRNLARQTSVWLANDPKLAQDIIDWTIAFPFATMQRLRKGSGIGTPFHHLSSEEVTQVNASQNSPLAIARIITARILAAHQGDLIDGRQMMMLDQNVQLLVDYLGACDRIRATPLPFAYTVHLRRVLIVYCLSLPLALIRDYGWGTVPTTMLISYSLFGIEEIGVEIEDPFGLTANDLPLESICDGIQSQLAEIRDTLSPVTNTVS